MRGKVRERAKPLSLATGGEAAEEKNWKGEVKEKTVFPPGRGSFRSTSKEVAAEGLRE